MVNFINVLCANFTNKMLVPKIQLLYEILAPKSCFQTKNARVKCWRNWHLSAHNLSLKATCRETNWKLSYILAYKARFVGIYYLKVWGKKGRLAGGSTFSLICNTFLFFSKFNLFFFKIDPCTLFFI